MLVVGLVPLLVLFLYGYQAARKALVEASDEHLLSVVAARRAQIESWLAERITDLDVISGSQDCIHLVNQAVSHEQHSAVCRYLDSFQTGARDYQTIALYDLKWDWVASQSGLNAHREALVDPAIRAAVEAAQGPVIGPVHPHAETGIGFHIANVLRPPGEKPVGYVVASLDLTGTFAPILADRAGLGRTGKVFLADSTGTILLSGAKQTEPRTVLSPEVLAAARSEETGTLHYRRRSGEHVFAGFTWVPETGWLLLAEMNQSEALGLLHSLRRGFLVAGLLTLAGVILLSSRTSRRLSAPLGELVTAARRIKAGHSRERVPPLEGREVGEVGRAFNEMLDSLEEIQRQRIQASTLAAVGELSSSMVHEIRNRLSSVKINLQAMERKMRDDTAYAELARIALEQVLRTEETLTDLLNYARPVEPSREGIAIRTFLGELADLFRAEASERGIRLEAEDRTGGGRIQADRRLLEQALANLVRNAMEVSPRGGEIHLRSVPTGEEWMSIEVEDDGPGFDGIPPEDLFKPFFTTKERGAGLGLAHARKIAELHGGRIEAEKAEKGGALFRMILPWPGRRA